MTLSFAPLVKEAAPAVVNIYARRVVEARRSLFSDDPFFGNFFRAPGPARAQVQNSLGSGVILSADGIVVSNYHVVGQATDIRVVLNDRREYTARVLLGDEESDLAILQLEDAQDMPHLALRDSDTVEVGELVLAIGNPFGVGQTVSSGIVSGLARSGTATGNARGYFIQTDAPINPGNSGGALIDMSGDVIGINTSILTRSGGSNGIGFAIPASLVVQLVAQARAGETAFVRPWAGVLGQSVSADLAENLGLDVPEGIILSELHPRSTFGAAGLRPGDIITHVDGLPVNTPMEMIFRMSVTGIGARAVMRVLRDGTPRDHVVDLQRAPDRPSRDTRILGPDALLEGVTLERINPAVTEELHLPLMSQGVVIRDPGGLGTRIGLRQGDILLGVNTSAISHPDDAARALRRVTGSVALTLLREGRRVSIRFRI